MPTRNVRKYIFTIRFFLLCFFLTNCIHQFPPRRDENVMKYKICRDLHSAGSCYDLAQEQAEFIAKSAKMKMKKKNARARITFYLRRACALKNWESCAVLGIWFASLKKSCSKIIGPWQEACDHGHWQSCLLLAFPKKKRPGYNITSMPVLRDMQCFPGERGFEKKVKRAVCMKIREGRGSLRVPIHFNCKQDYKKHVRYDSMDFMVWYHSRNSIFCLLLNKRDPGKCYRPPLKIPYKIIPYTGKLK